MIKLCHIITDTNTGGAGVLLINQLRHFDRDVFDITVVVPRGSELCDRIAALGYRVVESRLGADKSFELRSIPEYKKIFRNIRPDIVHCHSALSARIAALISGVPVRVYTRHCAYDPPAQLRRFPLRRICGGASTLLSNGIIAVAEAAAENLVGIGIPRRKINVIINGVEPLVRYDDDTRRRTRTELGFAEDDFVAGIFARLETCKGHIYLLRAAALAVGMGVDNLKILICGKGSLEGELRREAEALGIADRVKFAGFIGDITPHMNAVDLNLNCSIGTETSSLALSEGMSVGKPAVVSDYGGNPCMVEDGVSGIVVPRADPDALACALVRLAGDPALMSLMSAAAAERYQTRFSAKMMTEELQKLYLSLFKTSRDKRRGIYGATPRKITPR